MMQFRHISYAVLLLLPCLAGAQSARIRFSLIDTLRSEGRFALPVPGSDTLLGYQGGTVFYSPRNAGPQLDFHTPFSTPLSWSSDGRYLLAGMERYDWRAKRMSSRRWSHVLASRLMPAFPQAPAGWRIHNAQWHPSLRFAVVFSGYQGSTDQLPESVSTQFLHYLVVTDSSAKTIRVLDNCAQHDEIVDMALSDSILIAAGKNVRLWNLNRSDRAVKVNIETDRTSKVVLHPLLPLAAVTNKQGQLSAFPTNDPSRVTAVPADAGEIYEIVFHPELPLIFTTGSERRLRCWRYEGNVLTELQSDLPKDRAYSPAGFDLQNRIVLLEYGGKSTVKKRYALDLSH